MAVNGHARRLDAVARRLPTVRPSAEVLEQEYDRLIEAYERRQACEDDPVAITPKWPFNQMDTWMKEIIAELAEGRA